MFADHDADFVGVLGECVQQSVRVNTYSPVVLCEISPLYPHAEPHTCSAKNCFIHSKLCLELDCSVERIKTIYEASKTKGVFC